MEKIDRDIVVYAITTDTREYKPGEGYSSPFTRVLGNVYLNEHDAVDALDEFISFSMPQSMEEIALNVHRVTFHPDDFNDEDMSEYEEDEFCDLLNCLINGAFNSWNKLNGTDIELDTELLPEHTYVISFYDAPLGHSIIVQWQWYRYAGFCRHIVEIRPARDGETESLLVTENKPGVTNTSLLLREERLLGLSSEDARDLVAEKLYKPRWKWTKTAQRYIENYLYEYCLAE